MIILIITIYNLLRINQTTSCVDKSLKNLSNLFNLVLDQDCDPKNLKISINCSASLKAFKPSICEILNDCDQCLFNKDGTKMIIYHHTFWKLSDFKDYELRVLKLNLMSYLATQNLCCTQFLFWKLDNFPKNIEKDLLNTFSYYFQKNIIKFKVFNLKSLCKTTILFKNHSICSTKMNFMDFDSVSLSDFVRFFVLEQYQGIYSDGDVFYLRNMKILWLTNFVYRWSFTNGINTAVVGLNKHLNPSIEILYKTIIKQVKSSHALTSSFHPSEISQYMLNLNKNSIYNFKPLKTMHSFLFDPAWVCFDGVSPAFNSKSICNFIDLTKKQFINETDFRIDQFFPGAFSYHIHLKDARPDFISSKSYFVYFENYFKSVLKLK